MSDRFLNVSPLRGLPLLRPYKRRRESSWDRTGGNRDRISVQPGETAVLADINGPGMITHIWFTIAGEEQHFLRRIVLRTFWDGEKNPSILVPVGDFFGIGHAKTANFVSLPLQMSPQRGRGFNCFFPMPFSKGARIEVTNEGSVEVRAFYYYVDYEEHDTVSDDLGRFHAQWRRENPTQAVDPPQDPAKTNLDGRENYVILQAEGRGHYVGCNLNVDCKSKRWYGEGDDMIFIDGDETPTLVGTGSEDYFNCSWCPHQTYYSPYHGYPLVSHPEEADFSGKTSMYRFHIEDPVYFEKSIKVTIEHGHANALSNDYSSTAYWYQAEPHKPFDILPVEERLPWQDEKEKEG